MSLLISMLRFNNLLSIQHSANNAVAQQRRWINLLTRFRIVDNCEIGKMGPGDKQPMMIGRNPNRSRYNVGDVIAVSFKHKVMKAMIVALKQHNRLTAPKYSDNCVILLDENKVPLGSRTLIPLPAILKKRLRPHHKIFTMCKKFL